MLRLTVQSCQAPVAQQLAGTGIAMSQQCHVASRRREPPAAAASGHGRAPTACDGRLGFRAEVEAPQARVANEVLQDQIRYLT